MNSSEIIFFCGFLALIALLLALDIGVFHKKDHVIGIKEAAVWTVIWISIALLFDIVIFTNAELIHGITDADSLRGYYAAYCSGSTSHCYDDALSYGENLRSFRKMLGMEYLAGYLMEKTLSIDNIFVMIMIFLSFGIDRKYYHRVLFWGIIGALVLRFIFIFAASALIARFSWILGLFGAMLIYSGVKMFLEKSGEEKIDTVSHPVVRFASKIFRVSREQHGHDFFAVEGGKRMITPLFIVLLVIEFSDVIFAVDSIPAVFSITKDPFIVFFSNIFAILGLRSLFFLLDGIVSKFTLLKYGLGVLLTFIGVKMIIEEFFGVEISTAASLIVILGILTLSIVGSMVKARIESRRAQ